MNYTEFESSLKNAQVQHLVFELPNGESIHHSYHITEIKKAMMQTIDCGKSVHVISESILQLYIPTNQEENRPMTVTKALGIMGKVNSKLVMDPNSNVIIEFGLRGEAAARYEIKEIASSTDSTKVTLKPFEVACKPALAFDAAGQTISCC